MKRFVWGCISILLITSCASSHSKKVFVDTEPKGATVRMGEVVCETPCTLIVPKDKEYVLHIKKEGFEDKVIHELSKWEKNPWLIGAAALGTVGMMIAWPNMIIPTVIGGSVASSTRALNEVHVIMQTKQAER